MSIPPPKDPSRPYRICVVCLGNICRSPIAEVVLIDRLRQAGLDQAVAVDSAGTGDWHVGEDMDRRSRRVLEQAGYHVPRHQARRFGSGWLDDYDLILTMDRSNLSALRRLAASATDDGRVRLFGAYGDVGEVPDPYDGGPEGFTQVLGMVEQAADTLVKELTATLR